MSKFRIIIIIWLTILTVLVLASLTKPTGENWSGVEKTLLYRRLDVDEAQIQEITHIKDNLRSVCSKVSVCPWALP
jgi:hypothetical protein